MCRLTAARARSSFRVSQINTIIIFPSSRAYSHKAIRKAAVGKAINSRLSRVEAIISRRTSSSLSANLWTDERRDGFKGSRRSRYHVSAYCLPLVFFPGMRNIRNGNGKDARGRSRRAFADAKKEVSERGSFSFARIGRSTINQIMDSEGICLRDFSPFVCRRTGTAADLVAVHLKFLPNDGHSTASLVPIPQKGQIKINKTKQNELLRRRKFSKRRFENENDPKHNSTRPDDSDDFREP